ncbi:MULTISPECIES: peptidase U32 family protein [unclassified Roseburia]|uniref:peptidase U32 family protein n=1 Tax=unclassified Roseburia TaxID=2637578 RepID=UPI000E46DF1C|nr:MULTISPECIES: U32 family peptidase [unclassified Roseburia]RGG36513.1 U32 family peptidase [Roseburia sp. AF22-8AC]RGG41603.1 U32 family peptidase [Roseburia sp. AF22-2LB]RHQ44462.1 U32 family peptidase [Roseburia sp. AF25-18LB]RHQ51634.1 U32 family peptidase [Roseburia sp. AF25-15LB]RHQ52475.1 U32 family peptidase [Roseburia sp. AF25-13LB]
MKELELLAPAGSLKTLKAVIHAGADAVYLGGSMFGARAYANNFNEEELLEAIRFGHIHGRKIILAVNTLLKEYELGQLYDYLHPYYEAGLDAVIVQDMGVMEFIKTHFPNLPIHTSTQMTITNVEGARLLKEQGVERVVTAREMSLEEIQRIHDEVGVELESFIHGALCYCYSGQCLFSSIIGGRSGNRGRCAQPCRLSYEVLQGEKSLTGHHATPILSLKDMCTLPFLYELADHGVYSFKIEGRMKTPEYAAGVVSIYRKYMDSYLDGSRIPVEKKDIRALLELGNRGGFTNGYYYHHNDSDMLSGESASHNKSEGVLQDNIRREYVDTELKEKIKGKLILNKECPAKIEVQYGKIKVSYQGDMVLVAQNRPLTEEVVTEKITKTGNTPFVFENLEVTMDDDIFMPVNQLNQLRRGALEALEEALLKPYERTLPELVETSSAETDRQTTGNVIKEKQISGQSLSQTSGQQSAGSSTEVRVLIEDAEQLPAVLKADFVDTVYLDCMLYTRENLIRKLSEDIDRVQASGKKAFYVFPFIFRQQTSLFYEKIMPELKKLPLNGIMVRSLDEIAFIKEWGNENWQMVSDSNLYTYSNEAAEYFYHLGMMQDTIPVELNRKEILRRENSRSEMIIYGRLPLMITAQCIHKNTLGCMHQPDVLTLKDRYSVHFPVKNFCSECYNVIYNSLPVCLFKEDVTVKKIAPAAVRLSFTIETEEETEQILTIYGDIYKNGGILGQLPMECTNGHFKRGVE